MYRNYEVRCNTTQATTADNYIFYKTPSRTCDCDSDRGREHDMTSHKNLARERGNKYNLQI